MASRYESNKYCRSFDSALRAALTMTGGSVFTFRNATEQDAEFVLALFERAHVRPHMHAPARDAYLASLKRPLGRNLIIERDGSAFGNLVLEVEGDWLLTVRAVAVWEPRCGAGRRAMERAIAIGFDELHVHRIFLEVVEGNTAARRLYERVGFRPEGVYRDGYRDESGAFYNLVPYALLAGDR